MFRKINCDTDRQDLPEDLIKLTEWPEKWKMVFNFEKYKCLHTGHVIADVQYTMGGTVLTISADMKISQHYRTAASKGNPILDSLGINLLRSLHTGVVSEQTKI